MINDKWNEELALVRASIDRMMIETDLEKTPAKRPVRQEKLRTDPASVSFIAGALLRRGIRRELLSIAHHGITFTEEKALLDSFFVVSGPYYKIRILNDTLRDYFRRLNA